MFFFLRIQLERQREIETFTRHEGIARIVISQGVIRKDLDTPKHLQGWQRGRHGYKVNLPNCPMIQDLGGWGTRVSGRRKPKEELSLQKG